MDERKELLDFMNKLVEHDFEGFPMDDVDEEDDVEIKSKPKKFIMFDSEEKNFAS